MNDPLAQTTGFWLAVVVANAPPSRRPSVTQTGLAPPADEQRQALAQAILAVAERADKAAFAVLYRHFAPRLKSYYLRLGVEAAKAEDLAQEVMTTLWRKAAQYDPAKAEAATWVFTIARNLRIDVLRRERRPEADDSVLETIEDEGPRADDCVAARQRADKVRAALQTLPPEQAEVVRLSFFEDKPHGEIAADLGIPLGTVKSRLRLAMRRVRSALGDEEP